MEGGGLRSMAVLIPAREVENRGLTLVKELANVDLGLVIVVDDGSSGGCAGIFAEMETIARVKVLRHAVNLGKGRALKTGINYFLSECDGFVGLVTADADGQHTVGDIVRVCEAFLAEPKRVVLGAREFQKDVPLRSKFGNVLTRNIFGFVTGTKLRDTQTGLRVFPREMLRGLMTLEGERYEYEMNVLTHVCRAGRPVEVPIETVYIDGNKSSHFDPVWDSMRIYFVLVRFYASSVLAAGIDFLGFSVAMWLTGSLVTSVVVGRLSSLVNFALNKKFVFQSGGSVTGALGRYYVLVAGIAVLSYGLIWLLTRRAHWNVFAAKVFVDVLLSLVSFSVQRTFVFRRGESA